MVLRRGEEARRISGLPRTHANCFQHVANDTRTVIMLRAPGEGIRNLISDFGYASKSFHFKSKSCNWGPMLGFVCADPRFSKSQTTIESVQSQVSAMMDAYFKHKIQGVTPIYITSRRILELVFYFKEIILDKPLPEELFQSITIEDRDPQKLEMLDLSDRICTVPNKKINGFPIQFRLVFAPTSLKENIIGNPFFHPTGLWKIQYLTLKAPEQMEKQETLSSGSLDFGLMSSPKVGARNASFLAGRSFDQLSPLTPKSLLSPLGKMSIQDLSMISTEFNDVLSIVDPECPPKLIGTPRSATVSDYDLFGVFPAREVYNRDYDSRIVTGSEFGSVPKSQFYSQMHPSFGNTTKRIVDIMDRLNRCINYNAGILVHHGDEGGRPSVKDIEFPFVCFIPHSQETLYVENVLDFKEMVSILGFKYVLQLNPGWLRELGIERSMGHSFTV